MGLNLENYLQKLSLYRKNKERCLLSVPNKYEIFRLFIFIKMISFSFPLSTSLNIWDTLFYHYTSLKRHSPQFTWSSVYEFLFLFGNENLNSIFYHYYYYTLYNNFYRCMSSFFYQYVLLLYRPFVGTVDKKKNENSYI